MWDRWHMVDQNLPTICLKKPICSCLLELFPAIPSPTDSLFDKTGIKRTSWSPLTRPYAAVQAPCHTRLWLNQPLLFATLSAWTCQINPNGQPGRPKCAANKNSSPHCQRRTSQQARHQWTLLWHTWYQLCPTMQWSPLVPVNTPTGSTGTFRPITTDR